MKPIDRITIIDKISRELQSRMTFTDIVSYLTQYKIKTKPVDDYRSKYVYSKDHLKDVPEQIVLEIAKELEIDHPIHLDDIAYTEGELRFWKPGHFKLFISHISSFKETVSHLKDNLEIYGISSFVAHEDIEPTKEWMIEIEKALSSMDAMAALIIPDFHDSKWTDQEIGIAIGKNKLVIPITKGINPYGFLGKYQGFKANGKMVHEVALAIFKILCRNDKTKNQILNSITDLFLISISKEEAIKRLSIIEKAENFSKENAERIASRISENPILMNNSEILTRVNIILGKFVIEKVSRKKSFSIKEIISMEPEDLPF
jgi:hypothetical protein